MPDPSGTTTQPRSCARIVDGAETYARLSANPLTVELLDANGAGIRARIATVTPGAAQRIHIETVKYDGDELAGKSDELDVIVTSAGMVTVHLIRM